MTPNSRRCAGIAAVLALLLTPPLWAAEPLRVGIYQNRPGVFYDADGTAHGFYIEILEQVARQEHWELRYVRDSWAGLLQQLQQGGIDLVAGMAYTPERDRRFDFTREPLFVNWGQVYTRDRSIQSLLDLQGRRVVGLDEDIYALGFNALLARFDLEVEFFYVDSYAGVLEAVQQGRADAGITSRSNGHQLERRYRVVRSPIVCCSVEVGYAAAEGKLPRVLATLDEHLRRLKADSGSIYFDALDRWYGGAAEEPLPAWVMPLVGALALGALILFGGVLVLNRQVRERTRRLQEAHDHLEENVRQRTEELYRTNARLRDEINEHHKTQSKLRYLAAHDTLTGLPNRLWFSERLAENIKRAKRAERKLVVLFLDLDAFKAINDSHGHDVGDQVLVEVARRLRDGLREVDQIARLGGDEFIVMLPEVEDGTVGAKVAGKIIDRLREPFQGEGLTLHLGVSIGISVYPDHGTDAETLLRNADIAMYNAKQGGTNRFAEYGR